jgi:hypothetical protein
MVTANYASPQLLDERQRPERIGSAHDDVADEDQTIGPWRETNEREQGVELVPACVNVAHDDATGHGRSRTCPESLASLGR